MSSVAIPRSSNSLGAFIPTWVTLEKTACWLLVFAVVFLMGADFRGDTGEKFEVHWQIYLRLLIALASGAVGALLLFPRTYRDFLTWPGLLLSTLAMWYALTIPMSINKNYSLAAWISLVGVLLLIPAAMRVLGAFGYLSALAAGLVTYLLGSWIAYLFVPSVGVFEEQVTQTEVYLRMGGLGHPNELGFYSAYTVLVFAGLGVARRIPVWLAGLGMLLGICTLVGCFSRTAMIVCFVGLAFTFYDTVRRPANLSLAFIASLLFLGFAFVAVGSGQLDWQIENTLEGLTKTGSTDELRTATGRTEIWQYGLSQIKASPLYGYGYCTVRFVMEEYSFHCHNIVLNAAMFGGVIAGLIVTAMILYLAYAVLFQRRPEIDGLIIAMLAGGLVEGLLGAPSPSASLLIWITLIFWRQLGMDLAHSPAPTNTHAARASTAGA